MPGTPRAALAPLLIVTSAVLSGCGQPLVPPPKVTEFDVTADWGLFTHDILITSKHTETLRRVEVQLTVTKEQGIEEFTRHWSSWRPGEHKTVNIPASGGTVQRLEMSGTAYCGDEAQRVELASAWSWTDVPPD